MSLSLIPTQDDIVTELKTLPQTVYENGVPDDANLVYENGIMLPFIVPFFGGFARSLDARGIVSVRQDLGESFVIVQCVGPTERSSRQVADLVRETLTGFQPVDAGQLMPINNSRYLTPDFSSRPVKYIAEVTFRYAVNTNVVS
ncbi:hypothetical protein UFOVP536_15 [uncultured Caudovirales phage]|uniref:Uncharacterized protein n=1 Tax=uncultured Caudovirales phage TaxID=2100421 RepID=A0A6J5MPE5_9CAUD|nr:hypothetical protein UFOVP536_15 [uncultured Caudovirales phage]